MRGPTGPIDQFFIKIYTHIRTRGCIFRTAGPFGPFGPLSCHLRRDNGGITEESVVSVEQMGTVEQMFLELMRTRVCVYILIKNCSSVPIFTRVVNE